MSPGVTIAIVAVVAIGGYFVVSKMQGGAPSYAPVAAPTSPPPTRGQEYGQIGGAVATGVGGLVDLYDKLFG